MTNLIQRFRNVSNTAIVSDAISLNSSISTKIADANPNRISFRVNIDGIMGIMDANSIFIKLQAASIDDVKKGMWIGRQGNIFEVGWTMPSDEKYLGEISAIALNGTPDVFVTEY